MQMTPKLRRVFYSLFFLSGFASLLYQVIWLRKAFAAFGIITPVLSVVLSTFMLGLSLGSWLGGRWAKTWVEKTGRSPLILYALAELFIGIGGITVPWLFQLGESWLLQFEGSQSGTYLAWSACLIAISLLPWCLLMGSTFPLMMAHLKNQRHEGESSSFSFLYTANVLGALAGVLCSALTFIETLGFSRTLYIGALANFTIAAVSLSIARGRGFQNASTEDFSRPVPLPISRRFIYWMLFLTGFCSMGMEVAWTRAFTPVLTTTIYAFAGMLAVYLFSTWFGSRLYRRHLAEERVWRIETLVALVALSAALPVLITDPRILPTKLAVFLSIFPFCALLGYLTPLLIDGFSRGEAQKAGHAYAINVIGCVLGPLFSGYLLLPWLGVKWVLILLSVPLFITLLCSTARWTSRALLIGGATLALLLVGSVYSKTYEDGWDNSIVRRDYTATVIAEGTGMNKRLMVNGVGITILTPITKIMAHLPLAMLPDAPKSALVICFGMGTTFRSLLTWNIDTTAVELVPSVKEVFSFYHSDAEAVLRNPRGDVVIDDGRRFLNRSVKFFDVITSDPPPPVEAAGSSMLYSTEYYTAAKRRLKPGGIVAQWYPGANDATFRAVLNAISSSFKFLKVYRSMEGLGFHLFASDVELHIQTAAAVWAKLPVAAKNDFMEWFPGQNGESVLTKILGNEVALASLIAESDTATITDDRPYNEYFLLRQSVVGKEIR